MSGILAENGLEGGWQDTVLLISLFSSHRVFPSLLYSSVFSAVLPYPRLVLFFLHPLTSYLCCPTSHLLQPLPYVLCSSSGFSTRDGEGCFACHGTFTSLFPIRRDGGERKREIKRGKRTERRGRGGGGGGREKVPERNKKRRSRCFLA